MGLRDDPYRQGYARSVLRTMVYVATARGGLSRALSMAKRGASRRDLDLGHGLTPITVLWYDTTLV